MSGKRYSEEQIIYALKQMNAGTAGKDICLQMGVSDTTFYAWSSGTDGRIPVGTEQSPCGLTAGYSPCSLPPS